MDKSVQEITVGLLASLLILSLAACGAPTTPQAAAEPSATPLPPTATPLPPEPTSTPLPPEPTPTPVPPEPTSTPVPPEPTSTPVPAETEAQAPMEAEAHEEVVEEGQALFAEKGCAACHGPEAEGTEIGPALPGHTAEQILRQVRDPLGKMPPFTEEQISDAELEKIVAYITSLAPVGAMHMHEDETSSPAQAHLQMALIALESDNIADAQHHLQHAIEAVEPGQAEEIQTMLDSLNGGDIHEVQHGMEEMLAEAHDLEEKTLEQLHLEMALSALEARDVEDAHHHVEHFVEASTGTDKLKGQQILKLMDEEDFHEAGHEIERLLGMTPHGE